MTPDKVAKLENVYRQVVGIERELRDVLGKPPPKGYSESPSDKTMAEMVSEHAAKTFDSK